ncbi:hypothetical protein GGP78_003194 [Salinibacter ruber]|nr:hypothetical protein [Salinibacter ruber]
MVDVFGIVVETTSLDLIGTGANCQVQVLFSYVNAYLSHDRKGGDERDCMCRRGPTFQIRTRSKRRVSPAPVQATVRALKRQIEAALQLQSGLFDGPGWLRATAS